MKIEVEDSCNLLRNWMTKSSDKSRKLHKQRIYFFGSQSFGSIIFMDLCFWVRFCSVFFWVLRKMQGRYHIHLGVPSLGVTLSVHLSIQAAT